MHVHDWLAGELLQLIVRQQHDVDGFGENMQTGVSSAKERLLTLPPPCRRSLSGEVRHGGIDGDQLLMG